MSCLPPGARAPRGRRLSPLIRSTWVALTLLSIVVVAASVPSYYDALRSVCFGPAELCALQNRLNLEQVATFAAHGFSLDFYATFLVAVEVVFKAVWIVIGIFIFMRRSDDWMALAISLWLITFSSATFFPLHELLVERYPAFWFPAQLVAFTGDLLAIYFFFLFPDGRFTPRWTLGVALLLMPLNIAKYFFPGSLLDWGSWPPTPSLVSFMGFLVVAIYAQIYRYRRVSTAVQRYQTKWVVTASAVGIVGMMATTIFVAQQAGFQAPLGLVGTALIASFMLLIPVSIAVAVLRYRLFEIDSLINRALVYTVLTAVLAAVYLGSVILLQQLFGSLAQQQSQFSIVLSTLLIAALFSPLRRRVQNFIDLRFYRRKYDAQQTLSRFSQTVHEKVNLEELTVELRHAVADSLQPRQISIWFPPMVERAGEQKEP